MKKQIIKNFLLLGLFSFLTSCYYQGPDKYEELDIVYTNYDKAFDFTALKKYTMPDKIVKVTGNAAEGKPLEYVNANTANLMINTIKANMSSMGYVYVADTAAADLLLIPAAMEVTNVTYYYNYWGYYYGWYYPYYGYYYPYGTTASTYQTGTIVMDLSVKRDLNPTNKSRVVWLAAINGLLEGTTSEVNQRAVTAINQAFKQSEYLR